MNYIYVGLFFYIGCVDDVIRSLTGWWEIFTEG